MDWIDIFILFLSCIFEVFLIYDYFHNFFEIRIDTKYVKICFFGATCLSFLINIQQSSMLNLVCVPLVLWVFVSILFDVAAGTRLVYFVIACVIMTGSEFLYILMTNTTAALLSDTGLIPVSEYFWQLILIKFINYILFIILKQIYPKSKCRMEGKLFLCYISLPILTLIIMSVVFYSGIDIGSNEPLKIILSLLFICLVVGNIVLFYAFQKYAENLNKNAEQQVMLCRQKTEIDRLTNMVQVNDRYNEVIHDASNYIKMIGQLAYENKNEEICRIVDSLNGTLNRKNIKEYSSNKLLNVILSDYADKADKEGVRFDIYVEPGCRLNNISDEDLINMVSNLIDNAILAASKEEETASVVVRLFMQNDNKLCIIKVVNDFSGKVQETNGKLKSTKNESGLHGIGLSSVSRIAVQNNGYFEHYIEDGKFNAVIVLNS